MYLCQAHIGSHRTLRHKKIQAKRYLEHKYGRIVGRVKRRPKQRRAPSALRLLPYAQTILKTRLRTRLDSRQDSRLDSGLGSILQTRLQTRQWQAISDHIGPSKTNSDHLRPPQTFSNHLTPTHLMPFQTISDHLKPYQTIPHHLRQYQTISDHLKPYQTIDQICLPLWKTKFCNLRQIYLEI